MKAFRLILRIGDVKGTSRLAPASILYGRREDSDFAIYRLSNGYFMTTGDRYLNGKEIVSGDPYLQDIRNTVKFNGRHRDITLITPQLFGKVDIDESLVNEVIEADNKMSQHTYKTVKYRTAEKQFENACNNLFRLLPPESISMV